MGNLRIAIDAGHGMNTAGKRCMKKIDSNETREWYLNQRIASKVVEKLKGYENVETLRVDDVTGQKDVPLATRCKSANQWGADIYCSFHHNAGINGGAGGGLVVFTYDDSAKAVDLRNTLYDALLNNGGIKGNRSTPKCKNPGLYVLNSTKMIAVLVEHGFMDSTVDTPIILTEQFAENQANGWIQFFEKFYGIRKKEVAVAKPSVNQPINAEEKGLYLVKVTTSSLNVRENPGTSAKVTKVIKDRGVYTIMEEKNIGNFKWGRLKSGGWISLMYTKRL